MKSKASIKSHPLHPMLIVFPIAFYIGTLLFDCLAVSLNVKTGEVKAGPAKNKINTYQVKEAEGKVYLII